MPTIYVLLAAVLWSTGGLGVKSVDMQPLALAGFRSAFAAPVLAVAAVVLARRHASSSIAALLRRPLVWAAAFSYAVMVVSFVIAAKMTTAANAILLQYSGPIYVALLSWPVLRERVRATDIAATVLCFFGMCLFFLDRVSAQGRIGDLVAIVSSFGFAGVPLLMRLEYTRRPNEHASALGPAVAMTLGNLIACAVAAPSMVHAVSSPIGLGGWGAVVFLGVFQIGVAYVLYAAAVNALPALRSTLLATIEPILNPLWVAIVRGEKPTRWAAIGGAVILVSVTLQAVVRQERK
ncbi:MAG TPA: EamA family transporter [Polyangiaceae bacterium]|nr:EamA family transporter [Polyangiaceae bacterium]